jgi:hypothetical protein
VSTIANATSASVRVTGGGNDTTVNFTSIPGAASAIVPLVGSSNSTALTVTVTAVGPGGQSTASTGFTASSCKL